MFTTTHPPITRPSAGPTSEADATNRWLLWRTEEPAEAAILSVAELADCRCPELCDRDHANE